MITPVYILNTLIVLGIVVSAVLTVTAKRTLSSIICLAACGAISTYVFNATIRGNAHTAETLSSFWALTTIIFVVALRKTGGKGEDEK